MDNLGRCKIDRYLFMLHSNVTAAKSKKLLWSRHAVWKGRQEIFHIQA
jgi:hypothetical protein